MAVNVDGMIGAPRECVWKIVTDFEHVAETLSGVTAARVLERPAAGLVGLTWEETRTMFGKAATETMRIGAVEEGHWYESIAHNHGVEYRTRIVLADEGESTRLAMTFSAVPKSPLARLMAPLSRLFEGTVRKLLRQDLDDVRVLAEARARTAPQRVGSTHSTS